MKNGHIVIECKQCGADNFIALDDYLEEGENETSCICEYCQKQVFIHIEIYTEEV